MKSSDSRTPCILIADDQTDVLEALHFLIKGEGYQAEAATSPSAAIEAVESRDFDAVVMDLNYTRDTTSGQEGLDLLNRIQSLDSTLPVIVMTAWGSVELAVEAMRRGARDFIQKPWDNARFSAILKTQIELGRALRKGQRLEAENHALRAERSERIAASVGGRSVAPEEVLGVACDVLAPCAQARVITTATVPTLGCRIVAGAANDVLSERSCADELAGMGITYVPDFLLNAGGVIHIHAIRSGWDHARLEGVVMGIGDRDRKSTRLNS